jgi:enoyl-CoA hydratase/carnithine racemase
MPDARTYETLIVRHEEGADWLTLNRPERLNAFDRKMVEELDDYFRRLMTGPEVRVVVLRGSGRAFCAGVDLKDVRDGCGLVGNGLGADLRAQRRISEVVVRMRRCPQPIIALMHGVATGGGFALSLAADIRIAASDARMNCAFLRLGLTSCDMGLSYLLPRMAGVALASELMLTGRFIDAERALRAGIVNEMVPEDELEHTARSYVRDMLAASPLGLKLTKEGIDLALAAGSLETAIAIEDRNQVLGLNSANFREGLAAYFEKRPGVFEE